MATFVSHPESTTALPSSDVLPRDEQFLRAFPWILGVVGFLRLAAGMFTLAVIQFQGALMGGFQSMKPLAEALEPSAGSLIDAFMTAQVLSAVVALWSAACGTALLVTTKAISERSSHTRALVGAVVLALPTSSSLMGVLCVACGLYAVSVLLKPSVRATFAQSRHSTSNTAPAAS
jgi:hypothetical protein